MTLLGELNRYYQHICTQDPPPVPPLGFSREQISFAIRLNRSGQVLGAPRDLRDVSGSKPKPIQLFVPAGLKRSINVQANFLWDNAKYLLGLQRHKKTGELAPDARRFEAFRRFFNEVTEGQNGAGLQAVADFLAGWRPEKAMAFANREDLPGANLVFWLEDAGQFVHEIPAARQAWLNWRQRSNKNPVGMCLVSGKQKKLQRLHASLKGLKGAQSSGASLVSFNKPSFCSYGKEKSWNAPVGQQAEFAYTTVLNYLLKHPGQRMVLGDTTAVFWSESQPLTDLFGRTVRLKDGDPETNQKLEVLLKRFRSFKNQSEPDPQLRPDATFCVLGLSGNAARVALRFWWRSTVAEAVARLQQHFDDLAIERQFEHQPKCPGLMSLLLQTAVHGDADRISPQLTSGMLHAILSGQPYPRTLLVTVLNRLRVPMEIKRKPVNPVTYERAALIKAYLLRRARFLNQPLEVSMSLNPNDPRTSYQLGRLFALIEKAQEDAADRKLNRGLRERFFNAAMSMPASTFPHVVKMANIYMTKLKRETGPRRNYLRAIGEIVEKFTTYPKYQTAEEQGDFSIGYFHQRNAFFIKKKKGVQDEDA